MKSKTAQEGINDILENHNWSWIRDIYERNKNGLDKIALFYRGKNITYNEFFQNVESYAKALKQMNIKKGDIIPICMANCPEFLYLFGAISLIGARANIFGNDFDEDYILEIINQTNSKILFATDDKYDKLSQIINKTQIENIILSSLTDSLPNNYDYYNEIDNPFYKFENKVSKYQQQNNKIMNIKQFINKGIDYNGKLEEEINLEDDFTTTYSSGSTNNGRPKGINHCVRSYISMARFHDEDLSGLPKTKGMRGIANIPTHSNTNLCVCISDVLSQSGTVCLEPIYHKDFLINSVIINKPNFLPMTKCFGLELAKKIDYDPNYQNIKLPYVLIPTIIGEPCYPNEEKYINKAIRKAKMGKNRLSFLSDLIVCLSMGGGDCEHGGIFFTLYKSAREKKLNYLLKKKPLGLVPFKLVDYKILDEKGNECRPYQMGRLVANSMATMKEYNNNEKATKEFFVKDKTGKVYGDCSVYAYKDEYNIPFMKGRIGDEITLKSGEKIALFLIQETVLKDTKKILTSEVVTVKDEDNIEKLVIHVEMQPNTSINETQVLLAIQSRLENNFPKEITDNTFYRIRSNEESFPLTGCGKRNKLKLKDEKFKKCVKVNNNQLEYIDNNEKNNSKKLIIKRQI